MTLNNDSAYLKNIQAQLLLQWPDNRTINIVFHGHSVPAGYFVSPYVHTFEAYPHLLHQRLKNHYPFAVINIILSAVGGEDSAIGQMRFSRALAHQPDVLVLDYGLNDRRLSLQASYSAWASMIEQALSRGIKVILMTPNPDITYYSKNASWQKLVQHAQQIRELAQLYGVGLCDVFSLFQAELAQGVSLQSLLSQENHPNFNGHSLIAKALSLFFIPH